MAFSKSRHGSQIKLSSQELFAISQDISREFTPEPSDRVPTVDFLNKPVSNVGRTNDRQSTLNFAGNTPVLVSEFKFAPKELLAISQEISEAFSPRFSSKMAKPVSKMMLAAKELFEISQEISREFACGAVMDSPALMLLPVDPYHLHAYWHLNQPKANANVTDAPEDQLTLRIYTLAAESTDNVEAKSWFDVAIEGLQSQQTVSLPIALAETVYSAAIGKCYADNSFAVFAYSNITSPPRVRAEAYGTVSLAQALSTRLNASGQGK